MKHPTNEVIGSRDCHPRKHVLTIHIATGAALVLGALGGQTLTNDGMKNKTVCLWRAWIAVSSPTETTGEHTRGATPFLVVNSQAEYIDLEHACPMQQVWRIKQQTVESLNKLGHLELSVRSDNEPAMLAFRDAVIRELKERFGVRAIAQAPPKYDSA